MTNQLADNIIRYNRVCVACGSKKTRVNFSRKRGRPAEKWYHYNDGYICENCYHRIKINPRIINYKGRDIVIKYNPRTGICSRCGKKTKTCNHHKTYHDDDVMKDTEELCVSCHVREGWKIGQYDNVSEKVSETKRKLYGGGIKSQIMV